ncbi:hypothetical protein Ddye_014124 [Dipteronia dyeriana]|uniref:KIB1-4 beta-propeller domain-containing protein n=1 Tax=Dipteronia dyeriana TaxID=168575 RepID=A0AAE0CKV3_9ROSI|nr:hypothetical protein Ddye_014124 [Dipteronia dyeriana]
MEASSHIPATVLLQPIIISLHQCGLNKVSSNKSYNVEQVRGGMITQQHLAIPESDLFPQVEQGTTQHLLHFSSKGWLLDIFEWPLTLSILHPFSSTQIKLPQLPKNRHLFVLTFVLSSNPSFTPNYTVLLLRGGLEKHLSYSKPGDKAWTTINTGPNDYLDVIYFEGKFYTVSSYCQIMACDVTGDNQITMTQVANVPGSLLKKDLDEVYIVESS